MSGAEAARSYFEVLVRNAKIPGIQYLVVVPEGIVFEYAGGWADLAGRRELNAGATMMAYSMSKTITAAAVLQLVGAQTVRLDDPIDVYLESQPYGPDVTVRQLLSHTSGIPNPLPLRWVHPAALHKGFDERAALAITTGRSNFRSAPKKDRRRHRGLPADAAAPDRSGAPAPSRRWPFSIVREDAEQ